MIKRSGVSRRVAASILSFISVPNARSFSFVRSVYATDRTYQLLPNSPRRSARTKTFSRNVRRLMRGLQENRARIRCRQRLMTQNRENASIVSLEETWIKITMETKEVEMHFWKTEIDNKIQYRGVKFWEFDRSMQVLACDLEIVHDDSNEI